MKARIAIVALLVLASCASRERRRTVLSAKAPEPIGPYSQAVQVGDTLYASGQIGADAQSGSLVAGGIQAETRQALRNLAAVLSEAGFALREVVQANVYLADMAEFTAMNEIYAESFANAKPARVTVGVAALPKGARVEISVIAVHTR